MNKEKKSISEIIEQHPKLVFVVRLVFWIIFALIMPICFIGFRFELFSTKTEIAVSGWGIIVTIIVGVFVFAFLRYIKMGISKKHSMAGQCIGGIIKIIVPLIILLILVKNIRDNVEFFSQVLGCLILCEAIAIPINPMPKWAYDSQKEIKAEERKDTIDYLIDRFIIKKGNKK